MNRRSMLFLGLICCLLGSCGLSKYGIKEAWVFTEEKFRGNIQVDDQGVPITKGVMIETSIFFETKEPSLPSFSSAEINGKTYKINETKQLQSPFPIGKDKTDETSIVITAAPGNYLYKLVIESFDPAENTTEVTSIKLLGDSPDGKITVRLNKKAVQLLPQMVP